MRPISVTRPSMPGFDEYCNEIRDIWDSCWLTNMGIKHRTLEAELREYLRTDNITLFTNGHLALECVIAAMELTGEVITTPFTFASTTHAIVRNGLVPVFCDINDTDFTIDVSKIEALITDKTSAIVPVHVYGALCDVDAIEHIAKKHNLEVIYDAAHAFGVTRNGESVANFGDASVFSFHATKVFNTIEGGAVAYRDADLGAKLSHIRNFGLAGADDAVCVGCNAKMNEFSAAMGICNLRHVDAEIAKRKAAVEHYRYRLGAEPGLQLLAEQEGVRNNGAYFPVVFGEFKYTRDKVLARLDAAGITARRYFYPLTNSLACYRSRYDEHDTPVAKYIAERVLTLPLFAGITHEDIDRICDIILG